MARDLTDKNPIHRQKARAQRIDHAYHAKPHPWRRGILRLSVGLSLAAVLVILVATFFPQGRRLHLPGPVSSRHAVFGDRCQECHAQEAGGWGKVPDEKCMACHDGPIHHINMVHDGGNWAKGFDPAKGEPVDVQTPLCATCHAEHRDRSSLTAIAAAQCAQCHADLKVSSGEPRFATKIRAFTDGHPEFAAVREGAPPDAARLKFNHKRHLEEATFPAGTPLAGSPVVCTHCHKLDQNRTYMQPITYEANCQVCHALEVPSAANIGPVAIAHGDPELVAGAVRRAFDRFLVQNGGKLPKRRVPNPGYAEPLPGMPASEPEFLEQDDTRSTEAWARENAAQTLAAFFHPKGTPRGACIKCHFVEDVKGGDAVKIEDPAVPQVWFKHATFNHETHRVLGCSECHTGVNQSQATADVNLPTLKTCQECHAPSAGAQTDCVTCHLYHNRKDANFSGMAKIEHIKHGFKEEAAPAESLAPEPEKTPEPPAVAPAKTETPPETVKTEPPPNVKTGGETKSPVTPDVKTEAKTEDTAGAKTEAKTDAKPDVKTEAPAKTEAKAETPPKAADAKPAIQKGRTVICPKCGLHATAGTRFCARCGTRLAK